MLLKLKDNFILKYGQFINDKFQKRVFLYLLHDSLLVVIAQRTTELVIVHGWTVLLHAPQPGDLRRRRARSQTRRRKRKEMAVVTLLD